MVLSPFCLMQSTVNSDDRIFIKAGTEDNLYIEETPSNPSLALAHLTQLELRARLTRKAVYERQVTAKTTFKMQVLAAVNWSTDCLFMVLMLEFVTI